jgi:hypothetical protein
LSHSAALFCVGYFFFCVGSGNVIFFSFFFYFSYVHTRLGSFLPPAPTPCVGYFQNRIS